MIPATSKISNIYTIPPGVPFLRTLAKFALDLSQSNSGQSDSSALGLSRLTIYLPTRRAVRALREELSQITGPGPTILPSIRTLGDGEEELLLHQFSQDALPQGHIIPPASRQLILGRLVKRWVEMLSAQSRRLFQHTEMIIPSSSAESLWLAGEVGSLIDQMETEEISWEKLADLVPKLDEYADWWQLTLDFLKIATAKWPQIQQELGGLDASAQRRLLMNVRTNQLLQSPPPGPVIAAGSTGSIPATARFLKAIGQLEQGHVILPGLDRNMDKASWEHIHQGMSEQPDTGLYRLSPNGCEDHPQYGLSHLLHTLSVTREDVRELAAPARQHDKRNRLISIAMLPSQQTRHWRCLTGKFDDIFLDQALDDITLIEAPGERQEALAIALAMRQQLEIPDNKTALVTPDRNLARRVTSELRRFGLDIDDSGGSSLRNSPAATFVRLLISVTTGRPDVINLASFLKHRFFAHKNLEPGRIPPGRLFEICLLRDALQIPLPGKFAASITSYRGSLEHQSHIPKLVTGLDDQDWQNLTEFTSFLDNALEPVIRLRETEERQPLEHLFHQLQQTINNLQNSEIGIVPFLSEPGGMELEALFEEIAGSSNAEFTCYGEEFFPVFDALIAGRMIRAQTATHPDLAIYGPLEARLQQMDCVIMAGLNEGSWPQHHDSGPFLSRPMKSTIELATPERRTGLSAHDFEQLMGTRKVILSRSERVDNAPTVPSRWLQRLSAVIGEKQNDKLRRRGRYFLELANLIDEADHPSRRVERPCPTPPVTARPKGLSITEIETWIRDPYAIYAKKILKLSPMGALGTISEPALRGTILHDALAEFIEQKVDPYAPGSGDRLMELIEKRMQEAHLPSHLHSIWMPRFREIADAFIRFEQNCRKDIRESHCEIAGKLNIKDPDFLLHGRADRIDLMLDGTVRILDYKTGTRPTIAMAQTLAPQLALEGAIAMNGGFTALGAKTPSSLEYIRLRPRGEFRAQPVNHNKLTADELSSGKLAELNNLVRQYLNPDQGYLSRYAVELSEEFAGDYDHLARVREWSWGSDEPDGGSGDG